MGPLVCVLMGSPGRLALLHACLDWVGVVKGVAQAQTRHCCWYVPAPEGFFEPGCSSSGAYLSAYTATLNIMFSALTSLIRKSWVRSPMGITTQKIKAPQ